MEVETRLTKVEAGVEGLREGLGQVNETLRQLVDLMAAQVRSAEQIKTLFRMVEDDRADIKALEKETNSIREHCAKTHGRPNPDHDATVQNSQVSGIVVKLLVGVGLLVAGIMLGKGG
ncbi:hypothetical protein [Aminirod propionatiphilus]|uniref:Uncharacterized protein n=1 Tax=Aminirod propionatiphilus TaxID=3415223 RepID=A0ACD1DYA4_9BACT|nr:hypothetical protein KIH16_04510 [Synergistota bacterium]